MTKIVKQMALALVALAPGFAMAQSAEEPLITVIGAASRIGLSETTTFANRPVPADPEQYRNIPAADGARAVLIDFAQCLYKTQKSGLMKLTAAVPGSGPFNDLARAAADNRCITTGEMSFRPSALYGAAYVVRYRDAFRAAPPTPAAKPVDYTAVAKGLSGDALQLYVSSRRFADCVAQKDPQAAHAVVMGAPGGSTEAAAFGTINTALSACLGQGMTVKLTKDFVKGVLAEAMVRGAAGAA
ncbi:MAG: hypothetical protein ACKVOP_02600 [Sphingomonadaceae bacterium]